MKKNLLLLKDSLEPFYKYMTSISKHVYIDKLNDIVHKYNNTYHSDLYEKEIVGTFYE